MAWEVVRAQDWRGVVDIEVLTLLRWCTADTTFSIYLLARAVQF